MANQLSKEAKKNIADLLNNFPDKQAALMNAMRVIEKEFGYIDEEGVSLLSAEMKIAPAHIWGMLTFYTHFNRREHGKYRIMVCCTLMCALRGAFNILEHLKTRLGIGVGEVTEDGLFSIEKVECLASCGTAPVIQINEDYYENLTPEKLDAILDQLKNKG
jgi:NADH-quinone oxidoreductase subunit E